MNLHGAYFGVAEGSLFVLDPAAKEFRAVSELVANSECEVHSLSPFTPPSTPLSSWR